MPEIFSSFVSPDLAFTTGQVAPGFPIGGTAAALAASRTYVCRVTATKTRMITKVGFVLSASSGTNDACDGGIFNSDCTTLLGSSGSTTGKLNVAPGQQQLTLASSVLIVAGTAYYAAFATSATAGASLWMTSLGVSAGVNLMGSSFPNLLQSFQGTAFPLAAPVTAGGSIASVPILALLE